MFPAFDPETRPRREGMDFAWNIAHADDGRPAAELLKDLQIHLDTGIPRL